jgi:hypothetical protein
VGEEFVGYEPADPNAVALQILDLLTPDGVLTPDGDIIDIPYEGHTNWKICK